MARSVPLCVLDKSRPVKKSSPPLHRAAKSTSVEQASRIFHVLPPDTRKEDIPERPPEHWGIPVLGFILEHWLGGTAWGRAQKYDGIYHSSIILEPMHIVTDYDAIMSILKHPELFTSEGSFDAMEAIFGADSMILQDGAAHAALRATVAPAFAPALFPFFFPAIRARAEKTWADVESAVQKEGTVKLDPVFRQCYLSIVVEMTTGLDMDGELAPFVLRNFWEMMNGFISPPFGPIWDAGMMARDDMTDFLKKLISTTVVEKKHVIDKLREYGDSLSYKGSRDIRSGEVNVMLIAIAKSGLATDADAENNPEEVSTLANLMLLLWFAGYATSAATTSCAAFEMGLDADVWSQLRAEQDAITAQAGGPEVTYPQTQAMPLLDSFITEMLRMYPAAASIRAATADMSVLGRHVRNGEKVFLDFPAVMRDQALFDTPEELHVDRFVKKPGAQTPPAVLAFGAPGSPHYCLGAALAKVMMKTTLSVLLREYDMVLEPGQSKKYAIAPDNTPRSKVVVSGFERRRAD